MSLKRVALKVIGLVAATCATAFLTNLPVGPSNWREAIGQLSPRTKIALLVCVPLAWLLVEFCHAFFRELRVLVRGGGTSAAQAVGQAPKALTNVMGRWWDKTVTFFTLRSFDGRYRRRLYEDYGLFNVRGLGLINTARLDLESVYVELKIGYIPADQSGEDLLRRPVEGRRTIWDFLDQVKPWAGLVIVGAPGSGKSTLLQHLLLVFARNRQGRYRQRRVLPIFIELRDLKDVLASKNPPTLAEAIRAYWRRSSRLTGLMEREPDGWLEERLRSSRVLLLLDGLDEVPHAQRVPISRWVESQMRHEDHRRCLFIMTSRPAGYREALLAEATVLEVQSFSPAQTNKFIDCWYLASEMATSEHRDRDRERVRRRAAQEADDLRQRLRDNANLHALTVNPLLLTMLCMVHRYHGALPGSRSQLYGEICQVLLERWRQVKGIAEDLSGEQKLAILRPLAEEFMRREARDLPQDDIIRFIEPRLAAVGYDEERRRGSGLQFLQAIQANSGLLLERELGRWCFAHKTFQEYLTAEHWLRNPSLVPEWKSMVASVWWRETLLLYAARTDASNLVSAALAEGSPASWGLAYQCLTEAQSLLPDVKKTAGAKLRESLQSSDKAVFTPAAAAFHHFRQSDVRPVSDSVEERTVLVTQAEYQLFLDEMYTRVRLAMVPPHWISYRFSGAPEAPILGVTPRQAKSFAEWAMHGPSSDVWRLPDASMELPRPAGEVWWYATGKHSELQKQTATQMEAWAR